MSKLSEFLTVTMILIIGLVVIARSGYVVIAPKPAEKMCVTPISLPLPPLQKRIELPKPAPVAPLPVRKPHPPVHHIKPVPALPCGNYYSCG